MTRILKSCSWIRNTSTANVTTHITCASLPLSRLQYGIVLDAGSSHTSVYIYEWPAEKDNNTGRVAQRHVCQVKGICCTTVCVLQVMGRCLIVLKSGKLMAYLQEVSYNVYNSTKIYLLKTCRACSLLSWFVHEQLIAFLFTSKWDGEPQASTNSYKHFSNLNFYGNLLIVCPTFHAVNAPHKQTLCLHIQMQSHKHMLQIFKDALSEDCMNVHALNDHASLLCETDSN